MSNDTPEENQSSANQSSNIYDWTSTRFLPLESSGVVQLADDRLLVINDEEDDNVLTLLTLDRKKSGLPSLISATHPFIGNSEKCALADLEGVTVGNKGWVYVINATGMLTRFKICGNRVKNLQTCSLEPSRFFTPVPEACNVEGLCWDPKGKRLLVGFRNPTIDNQAQILAVKKLGKLFGNCKLDEKDWELLPVNLNGCAIRDIIVYKKGFMILSGPSEGYSGAFNLYKWDGKSDSAKLKKINEIDEESSIKHAEGIATFYFQHKQHLILVRDRSSKLKDLVKKCPDLWECVVDECPITSEPKKPVPAVKKQITMAGQYMIVRLKDIVSADVTDEDACKPKTEDSSDAPIEC